MREQFGGPGQVATVRAAMAFEKLSVAIGDTAGGIDDDERSDLGVTDLAERGALSGMGAEPKTSLA
jgi:hypothetical protein